MNVQQYVTTYVYYNLIFIHFGAELKAYSGIPFNQPSTLEGLPYRRSIYYSMQVRPRLTTTGS